MEKLNQLCSSFFFRHVNGHSMHPVPFSFLAWSVSCSLLDCGCSSWYSWPYHSTLREKGACISPRDSQQYNAFCRYALWTKGDSRRHSAIINAFLRCTPASQVLAATHQQGERPYVVLAFDIMCRAQDSASSFLLQSRSILCLWSRFTAAVFPQQPTCYQVESHGPWE